MTRTRQMILATLLAGGFGAASVAYAAAATPVEKAELAQLSPQLRSQVEARMKSGQTVHGILETMLLNNISEEFASGRVLATDFQRGDIVVENKAGQIKVFPFDVATLMVINSTACRPRPPYTVAGSPLRMRPTLMERTMRARDFTTHWRTGAATGLVCTSFLRPAAAQSLACPMPQDVQPGNTKGNAGPGREDRQLPGKRRQR